MRISINGSSQLGRGATVEGLVDHIREAQGSGFGTYWLAQTGLLDALTVFTAAAEVPDIELGTAVTATFPRHPTALAGQALTTQAALDGRLALGVGLSHQPVVEGALGMRFERPVRHALDYLAVLQPLLEEGAVDHDGELFTAHMKAPRPTGRPPALLLAALGPQMLRIAGSRTDGTLLWMVGPRTVADHVAPTIREAAEAAGRPAPRVVCSLPVAVTDDVDAARQRAARAFHRYGDLPSYRAMLDREGVSGPEEVAVLGDEAAVTDQLREIAAAGATEFSAVEFGADPDEAARTRATLEAVRDT